MKLIVLLTGIVLVRAGLASGSADKRLHRRVLHRGKRFCLFRSDRSLFIERAHMRQWSGSERLEFSAYQPPQCEPRRTKGSFAKMVAQRFLRFTAPMRHGVVVTAAALTLSACAQSTSPQAPAGSQTVPKFDGKPKMLAINGFNYTDLTISSFSVGSSGGGNIFVSSPTSGGGSTSCCVVLYPGAPLPRPLTIEWMRFVNGKDRWCKKTVQLTGPIPNDPTALGVHFMPDGEIQVEVTQGESDPKLRLERFNAGHRKAEGNVIYDEQKAVCKDGR